jgi:hypothetical protein
LREFGSVEVKEIAAAGHKDFKLFAATLTRNARQRLSERFSGAGPKLVLTLTLDLSGLKEVGGLISSRWEGTVGLSAAFHTDAGAPVARISTSAPPSANGQLPPAGDRLLDDVLDFIAAP